MSDTTAYPVTTLRQVAVHNALAEIQQVTPVLMAALVVCAVAMIAALLFPAALRVGYPFPLKLTELKSFDQVERILKRGPTDLQVVVPRDSLDVRWSAE